MLVYARCQGELLADDYQARVGRLRRARLVEDVLRVVADLALPAFLGDDADAAAPVTEADRRYVRALLSMDAAHPSEGDWWLGEILSNAATAGELRRVVESFFDFRVAGVPERSGHALAALRRCVWEYATDIWAAGWLSNAELHRLGESVSVAVGPGELETLAIQLSAKRPAHTAGQPPPADAEILKWGRIRRELRARMAPPPTIRISDYRELRKYRLPWSGTIEAGTDSGPPSGPAPDTSVPWAGDLRISNVERERVAAALTGAVDDGRLNAAEYEARLQAAQSAKTYRDLLPLAAGLDALASDAERAQVMRAIEIAGEAGLLDPAERLDLLVAARTATTDAELARLSAILGPSPATMDSVQRQSDRSLRAGDADREQVVRRLQVAVGEGRLTLDEFDDRAKGAYAARYLADLDLLLSDLPMPDVPPAADKATNLDSR